MSSTPHPVAALLDDALRAFFLKQEERTRPILPVQPFNKMKELKQLNEEVDSIATQPDGGGVYAELPYELQGLVRSFTPHPVSLLVDDAHYVWKELQIVRDGWSLAERSRLLRALEQRESNVRVAHFNWLQDRDNHGAWRRSGVTCGDFIGDDPYDPRDYMPISSWDYF